MEKLSVFGFLCVFVNMTDTERESEWTRGGKSGLGFCFETTPTWARPRHYGREEKFGSERRERRES